MNIWKPSAAPATSDPHQIHIRSTTNTGQCRRITFCAGGNNTGRFWFDTHDIPPFIQIIVFHRFNFSKCRQTCSKWIHTTSVIVLITVLRLFVRTIVAHSTLFLDSTVPVCNFYVWYINVYVEILCYYMYSTDII